MMTPSGNRRAVVFLGLAVLVLAAGLVTELTLLRPRLARWRALEAQRVELLQRLGETSAQQRENRVLAAYLDLASLDELDLATANLVDPVLYLDNQVAASGLERLELTSVGTMVQDGLRRSRFTLRARGGFAAVTALINGLEAGRRVVSVDAFVVERPVGENSLEARISLSVHDPVGEPRG
jgi:hypothetical protein